MIIKIRKASVYSSKRRFQAVIKVNCLSFSIFLCIEKPEKIVDLKLGSKFATQVVHFYICARKNAVSVLLLCLLSWKGSLL